jgi:FMN reductase
MKPKILGIGGTLRPNSTSECALRVALVAAKDYGADVEQLAGTALDVRLYDQSRSDRTPAEQRLVEAFRRADGVVIASPGYHGAVSGMVKNALDYVEDLLNDERIYFAGMPVGCISVAYGSQAAVTTLNELRTITHALRGFPTPYGAAVVAGPLVFEDGECVDSQTSSRLSLVGQQVTDFSRRLHGSLTADQKTGT